MRKMIISVLGKDRPGIIAAVTRILFDHGGNIENISQTILQNEFSGIFIVTLPDTLSDSALHQHLVDGLAHMGLHVYEKQIDDAADTGPGGDSEPFVVTAKGPDRKGLVASITAILAKYQVNVSNLWAMFRGGVDPGDNIMIYEVDIPLSVDHAALRRELSEKAKALHLDISIQHQRIFEALNRI
ncbi:ACT domain-containing protein [Desulfosarcina sp. OttesenSCG-928-G17]|nr:ACT domain-containing protein [Desulfosarcina sp. OttesenSCG-928-G17]